MAGLDPVRLSKTIGFLLRQVPLPNGLEPDDSGWFDLGSVARVVSRAIHRPVRPDDVVGAVRRFAAGRLEVESGRVRPIPLGTGPADYGGGPDLLYHASSQGRLADFEAEGRVFSANQAGIHLSRSEGQAWRVAHRAWEDPVVLYVDAARARREGMVFNRTRAGLYTVPSVPTRHVLNMRQGFAEQASAGGFLVDWSSGVPRIALIRVTRRHGATWEVAKGKMEAGEAPPITAVREVREEMGLTTTVVTTSALGTVQYGFYTREGEPRLKTIYLYMLEAEGPVADFTPAEAEGIDAVRWFAVAEAIEVLAHPSLRGSIGRLLHALETRAAELGLANVELPEAG